MSDVEDRPRQPGRANWILVGLIGAFGVVAFILTVNTGHADSALLFVALPVLLAAALALTPGRTTHGSVFKLTTVFLLLAAVALHEGAICVVLAAPLVYAVAHLTTALVRWSQRFSRPYALVAIPLLLLGSIEGTGPRMRIEADQTVQVSRVLTLDADQVSEHIAHGPHPTQVRPLALRVLGVPTPQQVIGAGLAPGDRWMLHYAGSTHGSGGHTVVQVSASGPGYVDFSFVEDTAITHRWFVWRRASIRWRAVDGSHTEVVLTLSFRRGLDPSWYFGPLQQGLMHEGATVLLDMLDLS